MWIHVYLNWKTKLNSRNGRNRSSSSETKALISFIPIRKMCLWCLIMRRKEIFLWIHVYPNWKMNFNSKNGSHRSFSYEAKAPISFIPMRRMCLWCLIMRRKEIIMQILFIPLERRASILKMVKKEVFLMNPKRQYYLSP